MNLYNGYMHEICVVIIHIYTWITVHHISYCEPPKTVCNRCSLSLYWCSLERCTNQLITDVDDCNPTVSFRHMTSLSPLTTDELQVNSCCTSHHLILQLFVIHCNSSYVIYYRALCMCVYIHKEVLDMR